MAEAGVHPVDASAASPRGRSVHAVCVIIHRYVGLCIATFLVVAGLTGSILVFYQELDAAANPHLFHAEPPQPGTPLLDPFVLRERCASEQPGLSSVVHLKIMPGKAIHTWVEQEPDQWKEAFINPYTGSVQGLRTWGDLSEGILVNLLPFIYRIHYQLALDEVGNWLFGIVALLWTIDCFIGAYVTIPPAPTAGRGDGRSWLARWKPAWLLRTTSLFGTIFTFHRASGLWLWALLFIFAWSGVGFNLRPVFTPVMDTIFSTTDVWAGLPSLEQPKTVPQVDWQEALTIGRRFMAEQATQRGFVIAGEGRLAYEPSQGLYRYEVFSSLDLTDRWPGTLVLFHGDSGVLIAFDAPTGVASGNTVTSWLFALHMGTVGGLAYRLLVVVVGLAVAVLSITGVIIWWRKRRRRLTRTIP